MENKEKSGISFPNITAQEFITVGSEAFSEQLVKMTKDKIIAPYSLIKEYRFVMELYRSLSDGIKPDDKTLTEAQKRLNFAIDHAKVNDLPFDELEALKNEINHIKYDLL